MYCHLVKTFPDLSLHVDFTIEKGCLAILGAPGCGKTAILDLLADPAGAFEGESSEIIPAPHSIYYDCSRLPCEEKLRRTMARCMAEKPALLLLDEPFDSPSRPLSQEMREAFCKFLRSFPGITVFTARDPYEAWFFSDKVLVVERGRVVKRGETWCTRLEEPFSQEIPFLYADASATALYRPPSVSRAVMQALLCAGNSGRGVNDSSLAASRIVFSCRSLLASLFDAASPEQIVFTANATEALNIAIKGLLSPEYHVITTCLEHNSVLRPLYELEDKGMSLTVTDCTPEGGISLSALENAIRPDTRAIVCTHASNVTGVVNDIRAVGALCEKYGLLLIVDASQTAGIFPLSMKQDQIGVLIFSGHKGLLGPQGTGGLCIAQGLRIRPLKSGGSGSHSFSREHPSRLPEALEAGTLNAHGIAGLAAGISFLQAVGLSAISRREQALLLRLYKRLAEIPSLRFYGSPSLRRHLPILAFNIGSLPSAIAADELSSRFRIAVRPGIHCAPLIHRYYHTQEQGMVRVSLSFFNTEEEVDRLADAVFELAQETDLQISEF